MNLFKLALYGIGGYLGYKALTGNTAAAATETPETKVRALVAQKGWTAEVRDGAIVINMASSSQQFQSWDAALTWLTDV